MISQLYLQSYLFQRPRSLISFRECYYCFEFMNLLVKIVYYVDTYYFTFGSADFVDNVVAVNSVFVNKTSFIHIHTYYI